jgi:hypothetical protein
MSAPGIVLIGSVVGNASWARSTTCQAGDGSIVDPIRTITLLSFAPGTPPGFLQAQTTSSALDIWRPEIDPTPA